jgi:hypothetical protein
MRNATALSNRSGRNPRFQVRFVLCPSCWVPTPPLNTVCDIWNVVWNFIQLWYIHIQFFSFHFEGGIIFPPTKICTVMLEDVDVDRKTTLQWTIKKYEGGIEVDWSGSGQGNATGFCEQGKEHFSWSNKGNFLTVWGIISFSRSTLLQEVRWLSFVGPVGSPETWVIVY